VGAIPPLQLAIAMLAAQSDCVYGPGLLFFGLTGFLAVGVVLFATVCIVMPAQRRRLKILQWLAGGYLLGLAVVLGAGQLWDVNCPSS
jgi:hypothetical protein